MPFWELKIAASPETSEGLSNLLWELGALGVVEEEPEGAPLTLKAFFTETASPATLTAAVSEYCSALSALGFRVTAVRPTVAQLREERWGEAWRQSFPPKVVGRRLLVAPPWDLPVSRDGRKLVIIEPGRAFGTGNHGSTQGCLILLDSFLDTREITHAADVGTGTGILAIAALQLGVPEVAALDTDPDALAEARRNAELNGVDGRVCCHLGGPEGLEGGFPLLLANLLAGSHVAFAADYRRLLASGGTLILGGLLADEEPAVVKALTSQGFVPAARIELEGWVSLRLTTGL